MAELAAGLVGQGWSVRVLTGGAGHPADSVDGIEVERVRGEPPRGPIWRRAVETVPLIARLAAAARRDPADVVVLAADPPMLFLAAGPIRKKTGAPVVHWAQDLYPDVAVGLGVTGAAMPGLRQLATRALRRCDAIVAIGREMARRVADVGADDVTVIPNWAPPLAVGDVGAFRRRLGLDDRFVVMYSGTLGLAHPYGALLGAAAELAETDPDVAFVVIGQGARREAAEAEARRRRIPVTFLPPVPFVDLGSSLGAADLHLVTMDDRVGGMLVPSKVYGALASARPVVFAGPADSEAAHVIRDAGAGTVLPSATGADLAQAVRDWKASADRERAGQRGADAVAGGLERAVADFDAVLRRVLR